MEHCSSTAMGPLDVAPGGDVRGRDEDRLATQTSRASAMNSLPDRVIQRLRVLEDIVTDDRIERPT